MMNRSSRAYWNSVARKLRPPIEVQHSAVVEACTYTPADGIVCTRGDLLVAQSGSYLRTLHLHEPFRVVVQVVHADRLAVIVGIANRYFPHVNASSALFFVGFLDENEIVDFARRALFAAIVDGIGRKDVNQFCMLPHLQVRRRIRHRRSHETRRTYAIGIGQSSQTDHATRSSGGLIADDVQSRRVEIDRRRRPDRLRLWIANYLIGLEKSQGS